MRTYIKDAFITTFKFAILACVAFITLFVNSKILLWANVPTGSMIPTIEEHSLVLGTRYDTDEINRYYIAIFKYPDDESQIYIKRVIGLPGETILIRDGVVYADGNRLEDDFVAELSNDDGEYEVPEGCYFMMGDNRSNSVDSRFWVNKYVEEDKILAIAKFTVYPITKFGALK